MIILGIETSCDETAASVVKDGREILSHVLATSSEMHAKTGGVIPENAAREQVKSIIPVIEEALRPLPTTHNIPNIDTIAVTYGPGLIGSLLVGVETAKSLSVVWGKPLVPINHLVAHIYANWLEQDPPKLPAIALVVSGGHTDLVYLKDHGVMEYIGGTRDDAAGEAFDKTARLLGLPYPGGPAIAAEAAKYGIRDTKYELNLPRPMLDSENYDFSFSGLKTAVLREVERLRRIQQLNNITIQQLSSEIQEAITDVLVEKALRAVREYGVKTFLLAGGVAANKRLTEKFKEKIENLPVGRQVDFRVPPPKLCTDNASYIAACAQYNYKPVPWQTISANPSFTIVGE